MSEFICNVWKVEHGSAAFIRTATPNDRTILFDAGCSDDFPMAEHLARTWKLNTTTNRLGWLIISHPDRDHIQDLPNVYSLLSPRIFSRNGTIPKEIVYPEGIIDLKEPLSTYKLMDDKYIDDISEDWKNPPASNWGGVLVERFCCIPEWLSGCPEERLKNNLSLVSYVKYGSFEIVLPGDLEPLGWDVLLDKTKILDYIGQADIRVMVASHHGRSTGIRNPDGTVYDRFLKTMKPHLVVISDKWGSEKTDREAYLPDCLGYRVYNKTTEEFQDEKVLTTKTNDYISIRYSKGNPYVIIP